jgi:diguanylate cyclase (GGDEF)-like protein/PAS domain S-box-containing protein
MRLHPGERLTPMGGLGRLDAASLERRLRRERVARREAEAIAEQVTRELYEAVQELAASKAVLDETTDFVAIADVEGRPIYLNRALCELLGIEVSDHSQVNVVDLLTPQSRARYLENALPVLREKGLWRGEFAWTRPGGGEIAVSQVLIAHRRPDGTIERVSSIARDVTEQRALQDQLAHEALHDALTGLANRRLFLNRLDLAQARASRSGHLVGVLFIDLDGFKAINDTLGHDAGDEVLVAVAGRLRAHLRAIDTLARFGGDEFAMLCEEISGPGAAVEIAERLGAAVAEPFEIDGAVVEVGASIGIAVAESTGSLDDLLQWADAAMYQAKSAGKAQWRLFDAADGGKGRT